MSLSGGMLADLHGGEGGCVLDLFGRPRRRHHGVRRQRSLSPAASVRHRRGRAPSSPTGLHYWVERTFRVDDAVGAVAVHGYAGFAGLVIAGFMLWGHPAGVYEGYASINPLGQFIGAVIMFGVLGFLPGFLVAKLLSVLGLLRIPREIEMMGLDFGDGVEEEAAAAEVRLAKKALV
jgi:hypothetical protein